MIYRPYATHMEDALEYYETYYKDVFLGVLIYDVKLRKHKFISNAEGISSACDEVWLIPEISEGTQDFVSEIPFFQTRLMNMKRLGLSEIRYHTDYFVIVKKDKASCRMP